MMRLTGPDDPPRISIVERKHPTMPNFRHVYVQVFLGQFFPEARPLEEFPVFGWKLTLTADQVRSPI